ncbi:hypothetical protein JKP88DRAFT_311356 [Tribonema minus]|uniref:CENP-V/GFA domain-containing protein n=1 Tax=Tribonema minus TaxID=303371 RepID=A0A835Z3S2_9STRA|nr:hypothetical protein JKP88DRAFT_311356 [Tribonema minus]
MTSLQDKNDRIIGALVTSVVLVIVGLYGRHLSRLRQGQCLDGKSCEHTCTPSPGRRRRRRQGEGGLQPQEGAQADAYYQYAYGSRSQSGVMVMHTGSCHCGNMTFEVQAPEHLAAVEGGSKLRYPFIIVPAGRFKLTSDESYCSLYLVKSPSAAAPHAQPTLDSSSCSSSANGSSSAAAAAADVIHVAAHLFCSNCGVHVCHAPNFPNSAVAHVNAQCLDARSVASLAVAVLSDAALLPGVGAPAEPRADWCEQRTMGLREWTHELHRRQRAVDMEGAREGEGEGGGGGGDMAALGAGAGFCPASCEEVEVGEDGGGGRWPQRHKGGAAANGAHAAMHGAQRGGSGGGTAAVSLDGGIAGHHRTDLAGAGGLPPPRARRREERSASYANVLATLAPAPSKLAGHASTSTSTSSAGALYAAASRFSRASSFGAASDDGGSGGGGSGCCKDSSSAAMLNAMGVGGGGVLDLAAAALCKGRKQGGGWRCPTSGQCELKL